MEPLSLRSIFSVLRCYKWLIVIVTVLCTVAGFTYGRSQTPEFTSFASVLIQPQRGDTAEVAEASGAGLELSSGTLEAEIRLIHSPKFVTTLIDELNLRNHPDFLDIDMQEKGVDELVTAMVERARDLRGTAFGKQMSAMLDKATAIWNELAGSKGHATQVEQVEQVENEELPALVHDVQDIVVSDVTADNLAYEAVEDDVVLATLDRLVIESRADAFLISIGYSSSDSTQSARVANRAAKLYVDWKLEEKLSSVDAAAKRLRETLVTVKQEILEAENEVERFKQENNLLSTAGGELLIDEELISAKTALNTARADLAAQIGLHNLLLSSRSRDHNIEGIADRGSTELLGTLKAQRTTLLQTRVETSINLGPNHPRMISLNAEIAELNNKIDEESDRIVDAQGTNVQLARERVTSFETEMARLRAMSAADRKKEIELHERERDVHAKNELYQALITRYQRTDQERDGIKADARIVSNALVPDNYSTPSPIGFALVGFVGSMSTMTLLVLLRERFRSGFRSQREAENALGIRVLGVIPMIKNREGRGLWKIIEGSPASMFTEAFSKIHTSLTLGKTWHDDATTLMVTSTIPTEGKTTLSSCYAVHAARTNREKRVIVVDLDFRRPSIKKEFGSVKWGLLEYLTGNPKLTSEDIIKRTALTNLDYLPVQKASHDSTLLMSSPYLDELIRELRQRYDLIVLDCPPVLAVNDTKIASKWADACLFAVKWSATAEEAVKSALSELSEVDTHVLGIVFTQASMVQYNNYNYLEGGKYHESYKKYYSN